MISSHRRFDGATARTHDWTSGSNVSGHSLLELIVAVSVVLVILFSLMATNARVSSQISRVGSEIQLDIFRRSLVGLLRDEAAWKITLNSNGTLLACANSTTCTTAADQNLIVYNGDGTVFYNPLTWGVTRTGQPCGPTAPAPYSGVVVGSRECPYRYTVTWRMTTSGTFPVVLFKINLAVAFQDGVKIKTERYSIPELYRFVR